MTVFVTTHYMDEAEYCDRLGLIYRGELIASGTPLTLKTEWMQDAVLEIACDDPQTAMEHLESLAGVKEVALFGKGIHVVVTDADQATAAIRNRLAAAGLGRVRVEAIVPSLEDVFVSLIEARDRIEAAAVGGARVKVGRIWAIARKEFLHIVRDPRSLGMAIAIPMLMLVLFGYALTLDVDNVPMVVWDQSETPVSRDFISRFSGSRYFAVHGHIRSYSEMERSHRCRPSVAGARYPAGLCRCHRVRADLSGADDRRRQRFQHRHHRYGLCRCGGADVFPASGVGSCPTKRPAPGRRRRLNCGRGSGSTPIWFLETTSFRDLSPSS